MWLRKLINESTGANWMWTQKGLSVKLKVNILEDQKVVVEASGWAQVRLIQAMPFSIPSLCGCQGDSAWTTPLLLTPQVKYMWHKHIKQQLRHTDRFAN